MNDNNPLLPEMFASPPESVRKSGAYQRLSKLMSIDTPLLAQQQETPERTHPAAEKYQELARKARKRGDRHSAAIYEHQARLAQQAERQDDSQDDEQPEQQQESAEPEPEPSIFDEDIPKARSPSPGGHHPRAPGRPE